VSVEFGAGRVRPSRVENQVALVYRLLMTLQEILPFLIPLIVLQLLLMGVGLYDLTRPERQVKGDSKVVWALIIIFVNLLGPLLYFLFGREEG
jgi:hypothetical protein